MTPQEIKFCYDAAYCNYRKISTKARCSMAPRNCEFEAREIITLQTGKRLTIYYCTLNPKALAEQVRDIAIIQPLSEQLAEAVLKTDPAVPLSCKIGGD